MPGTRREGPGAGDQDEASGPRSLAPSRVGAWRLRTRELALDRPLVVGILNVTPDSFSDGGLHAGVERAVRHTGRMFDDGATIVDIGGESTRPGRKAVVSAADELARVVPVIQAVARAFPGAFISIDTMKSEIARAALDAGAAIVNDVTGLRHDSRLGDVVAAAGAGLVLMHSRGAPLEIASLEHADYGGDVVRGVLAELRTSLARAAQAGVRDEYIAVDPGLGFSKTAAQNLFVTDQLEALLALGRPVLVGPSRKRFLGAATGREVAERDAATAAACALAWERGARIFRVHDVAASRDALAVAHALGHSPSAS